MTKVVERVLDKVSSYQIFNYLFPGIIFVNILERTTSFRVASEDVVYQLFLCYLAGMILSRIGSVVIEPLYKGVCWVIYSDYGIFLSASDKDEKIDIMSMENNTYRTLVSVFVCLIVALCLDQWDVYREFNTTVWSTFVYFFILTLVFSMSYAKQSAYVRRRVHKTLNINDEDEVLKLKEKQKKKYKVLVKSKKNKRG